MSISIDGVPSRPDLLRSTERGAQTRKRILNAAEQIFSQRGYAATRVEDIATAVGIRKPSVIHHFSGKAELLREVTDIVYAALLEKTIDALEKPEKGNPTIFKIADAWLDFIAARPTAGRLLLRIAAESSLNNTEPSSDARKLVEIWSKSVREASKLPEFAVTEPLELLSIFSGAALMFVSIHPVLAGSVDQRSRDEGLLESYRTMLHKSLHAILATNS